MAQTEYLRVALAAVKETDQLLQQRFSAQSLAISTKADGSVLTEVDGASETILRRHIAEAFPDHAIMGEEQGMAGESEYCWWLDPIDGTRLFSREIPFFATFIALTFKGQPLLGVISVPMMGPDGWLLTAEQGQGAWLNGQQVHVSTQSNLSEAVVDHGGLTHFVKGGRVDSLAELARHIASFTSVTTALAQLFVAQGSLDATIQHGSAWDFMAAWAIISEAGGEVTDLQGQPLSMDSKTMLASNKHLHQPILDFFKPASTNSELKKPDESVRIKP